MALVKTVVMFVLGCGLATAGDFGIDVGSPIAAGPTKVKGAAFSVRIHGCAGDAKFSGTAKEPNKTDEDLKFVAGTPGSFAVARFGRTPWLAVITADCMVTKAGAIVPVNAQGLYDRDGVRFFSHAPTAAEVDEALKKLQGDSR